MTSAELRKAIIASGEKGMHRTLLATYADTIMAKVKDHVVYVIGDDVNEKDPPLGKNSAAVAVQNELKAEQRNRAGAY